MARLLDGIAAKLRHLGDRQQVIAANIANADTPGFKARTLRAPDFAAMVERGSASARADRPSVQPTERMAALGATRRSASNVVLDRSVMETKGDGNNVTLETQLLALGEVQADHATLASIYRKQLGLIRSALGGRSA